MIRAKLLFEPRDLWVGVYWNRGPLADPNDWLGDEAWGRRTALFIYICLIPCIVLRLVFR